MNPEDEVLGVESLAAGATPRPPVLRAPAMPIITTAQNTSANGNQYSYRQSAHAANVERQMLYLIQAQRISVRTLPGRGWELLTDEVLARYPSGGIHREVYSFVEQLIYWTQAGSDPQTRPDRPNISISLATEDPTEREDTMLEQLLKLYATSMVTGVTSPTPHLIGPPGCGKSTVARQLADLVGTDGVDVEVSSEILGVQLHTINVSRISPLELEGVQMPSTDHTQLNLLHATFWTQLEDGDILLFDEFLRGFPEVYNGLLDILTSREVGGLQLKKVFVMAASNSAVAYDKALEDRLLHIPVTDPRHRRAEQNRLSQMLIDALGLHPKVLDTNEMRNLIDKQVLPMFEILDHFGTEGKPAKSVGLGNTTLQGTSLRKLIGQAQLREVQCPELKLLLDHNNTLSLKPGHQQYMFLMSGKHVPKGYERAARDLSGNGVLTELQQQNIEINLQLIELEKMKSNITESEDDDSELFA